MIEMLNLLQVIKIGKIDAQGKELNVYSNFEQYHLTPLLAGLVRMDMHRHPLRSDLEEVPRDGWMAEVFSM